MRLPKALVAVVLVALVAAFTVGVGARGQAGGAEQRILGPGGYDYTSIDVPGATRTAVFGINAAGTVAGRYMAGGVWRGFTFDGAEVTHIDYPGAASTTAYGINTRGDVAGTFFRAGSPAGHGFIVADGNFEEIATPDASDLYVYDINDSGTVLGRYTDSLTGDYVTFLWRAGEITTLPITGVEWAEGLGLNDRGQVAGHFVRSGDLDIQSNMRGFLFDHGTFEEIPRPDTTPPAGMSCLQGIGATGEAVGHVQIGTDVLGYAFRNGRFAGSLRFPGAAATYPHGVSPSGVIAGYYVVGGIPHGFIARAK
jgi:hypothetical protein